ncbi:putative short chain dehydrogenase [Aspergillus brunneoviolaceus CBS 621.78]|uniref:Short chain dehydrogenase n=1 Tax=Aspergillus brunneoviolaceus CBS 621.78 TaxID=1450534 RepID=A0ACD1G670_9EURO|nr:putative short chain dehydrogenase [Aspergillus brunneoviolaceus CBS 621.78]RAH44771.1 putative short chain dehydrogenase [Aspergillus brunneoviolaceus CBS 621.78]
MGTAGKTLVFITGANTGLGFEVAKVLLSRPDSYHILIGCRGAISRGKGAVARLIESSPRSTSTAEPISVDITDDISITTAFEYVREKWGYVDILVNNAGIALDTAVTAGRITLREGWNETYNVNVTGTHLFTTTFAPLLLASRAPIPRLMFITSGLSSLAEHADGVSSRYTLAPPGLPKPDTLWFPYRVSKTAMNMLATEWGRVLRNDKVAVFNISPGFLNTGLGDDRMTGESRDKSVMGAIDPLIGATFCADVIAGQRDEQSWPVKVLRKDAIQPW